MNFVQLVEMESPGILKKISDTLLFGAFNVSSVMNQSVPVIAEPDSLSQKINDIFIGATITGQGNWASDITLIHWDQLRGFAALCPFVYGENVYLSRDILKLVGDTTEYSNECENDYGNAPDKRAIFGSIEKFKTLVYPNPAQNEINVECGVELPATLSIYSALGELLKTIEITEEHWTIDISDIPTQIVLFEISNGKGELSRGTICVVR